MNELLEEYADDLKKMKEALTNRFFQDRSNFTIEDKVKLENVVIHLDLAKDEINRILNPSV